MLDLFISTRSRVIRICHPPTSSLLAFLHGQGPLSAAVSLWTVKEDWGGQDDFFWAVFPSHEHAVLALATTTTTISVTTALEADLEPFLKLRRVVHHPQSQSLARRPCIACQPQPPPPPAPPRHRDPPSPVTPPSPRHLPMVLTPSGRALSMGGRVQNISRDPLAPCIIFWPDNEPLPEQRQIRPPTHYASAQPPPPILNTGNKGPIEQQPGDWVCGKCEYLNWRRRKVCQTCYPYAEGNTDGISPTVQAERLAVLAQMLGLHSLSPAPSSTTSTYSPRSTLSLPLSPPAPPLVLPSYLTEEEDRDPARYYYPPLVVTRPLPLSPIIRRQSSLTFTPGHPPTTPSIWTMRKEEFSLKNNLNLA